MYTCEDCSMFEMCSGTAMCNSFVPAEEFTSQEQELALDRSKKSEFFDEYLEYIGDWQ